MRFAFLESVRPAAAAAARRFPLALGCAWSACAIFDLLILIGGQHTHLWAVGMVLTLGIPVCFAIALLSERRTPGLAASARLLPQLGALLVLAAIAWAWPHWTVDVQVRRYAQLTLFAHALAAFLPYVAFREGNGFWQYNRVLLERFVLATIFSGVLLLGLMGALGSLQPLFGITLISETYALLATWAFFVFHPWFFLAGIPEDLGALEARRDYPATVRVFAQFVLVPLVTVYQAVLTAYLLKVVVTGTWPSGLIGWLVSAEAIAGILAILLIQPVRERAENLWVRTFTRVFYLALIPSVVMLGLSIAKRVGQYGVTEDRYFVIALTAWLAAVSVYFIARRDGDIRWIPITLAALAVFTFGGPWGAYRVSFASQRARLLHLLEANGMWSAGGALHATGEISYDARRQMSSILSYLLETHGGDAIRPVLGASLAGADSGIAHPEREPGTARAQRVAARLGFAFVQSWEPAADTTGRFSWSRPGGRRVAAPIEGFDYHVRVDDLQSEFQAGTRSLRLTYDGWTRRMVLEDTQGSAGRAEMLASGSLGPMIAAIRKPSPDLAVPTVELSGPGAHGSLQMTSVSGSVSPTMFNVGPLMGDFYFSLRDSVP